MCGYENIFSFWQMKAYMQSLTLRKAVLKALNKTATTDELFYLKKHFRLMQSDANGGITLETIKIVKSAHYSINLKPDYITLVLDKFFSTLSSFWNLELSYG
ncbi:calcium-dependent protein kinase (CDPK) family protein [Striga asiatica]|uniref:Calcium-dependent protein kinase (CDPK) family protein n=1 Tax=Striga asiatica TaxID=4170 RepID=A0A5A7QAB1_STRAF|nr:calcium-dependent protein kinase (CDPK) family protein [Striga asiatica]